jgi:hypothetical protein
MKSLLRATLTALAAFVAASASAQQQVGRPADPPFSFPPTSRCARPRS